MPTLTIRLTRADRVRRGDLLRSRGRTLVVTETIRSADRTVLISADDEAGLRVMREAAAVILITSPIARPLSATMTLDQRVTEICTAQSVGAAIENMCLQATALGIGSLWICDSFFAQAELREEAGGDSELYALLALGYAAEEPAARPRRALSESSEWRTE